MTASAILTCGCRKTRLMTLDPPNIWIEWEVCALHYDAVRDDPMILEAAANHRKFRAKLKEIA